MKLTISGVALILGLFGCGDTPLTAVETQSQSDTSDTSDDADSTTDAATDPGSSDTTDPSPESTTETDETDTTSSGGMTITVRSSGPAEAGGFCFVVENHDTDVAVTCEADRNGTCCSGGNQWQFSLDRTEGKCGSLSEQTSNAVVTCTIDGTNISDFATLSY